MCREDWAQRLGSRDKNSRLLVAGHGKEIDNNLGVPRFTLGRQLHDEGEEEAWKGFEDGGGCDPGFLCICGKQICTSRWGGMEKRALPAVSHVCDPKGMQFERPTGVIESGESPQPLDDQGSAGTPKEEDEGISEDSSIGGWKMGLQSSIIAQD